MENKKKKRLKYSSIGLALGSISGLVPLSVVETVQLQNLKGAMEDMSKTTEERLKELEDHKVDKSLIKQLIIQIKEYIKNSTDETYKKTILAVLSTLESQL